MGPVKLNRDTLVNKAGIEVDVIPIMKSPVATPKHQRKHKNKRAKSEMGFYKDKKIEDDRGSLPDLKVTRSSKSLYSTILQMNPDTFISKSNESLMSSMHSSEQLMSRSLDSGALESKGALMSAVTNWLQKSSPFSSIDNIDRQSIATSIPDTLDTGSLSLYDDIDNSFSEEKSHLKSDPTIPDILISESDLMDAEGNNSSEKLGKLRH